MRLNLGCGTNLVDGYVNVDMVGKPDVLCDLEVFPWPWPDSSVDEVRAHHVLEHLGRTPEVFVGVVKEMWRVCRPGARVDIVVPHPRSDDFLNDPTHVRPITFQTMRMFSRRLNLEWQREGWSDTKLALIHGVDFEPISETRMLEPHVQSALESGQLPRESLEMAVRQLSNVVKQTRFLLEVVKP